MASSIGLSDGDAFVTENTELSGWWRRVGASLIDWLIVGIPLLLVLGVLLGDFAQGAALLGFLLLLVTSLLYSPVLMARSGEQNGQTFGKQIAGIRVVHESGEPMDFGKGIIRDFVGKGVLGLVPFYGLVDSLFPLGDSRNQAIHDKVGSTTVHLADG